MAEGGLAPLPRAKTWTAADFADRPAAENGDRDEIVEGEVVVTPSPAPLHRSPTIELALVFVGPFVEAGRGASP